MRNISNIYKLSSQIISRNLLRTPKSELKFVRKITKTTDTLAGHQAALISDDDYASITKMFPTSHQSFKIGFQDNLASDFQYIWLRDNCQCSECIHSESKQKMVDTVSLDINLKPESYEITDDGDLKVIWPDGHTSHYEREWLHKYGKGFQLESYDSSQDSLPKITTWNVEKIQQIKPEISYKEVMETEEGLKEWLTMIYKYGLAIMKGVPCEKGEVVKVIERSTYVRKTKWGMSFDVLCEPVQNDPKHLAYTGMDLELHTDMNYLENSPGLQALHCIKANPATDGESVGGKSSFVDGFHIAKWLRKEHPSSFHVLTSTMIEFKIQSHNMEYSNNQYVLRANKSGDINEVHYNTRTMAPLRGQPRAVQAFYGAYKLFGQKMRDPECLYAFNLVPGDLVAFNNRRILHGRSSFDPRKMYRHLEGCYGDIHEVITRCKTFLKEDTEQ